jgi:hypothetical protein
VQLSGKARIITYEKSPKTSFITAYSVGMGAAAQDRTVSGRVIAKTDGAGLPGIGVTVKGSHNGTATDSQGNFMLRSSEMKN